MRVNAVKDFKQILPKNVFDSCAITSVGFEYEKKDSSKARVVGSVVMAHRLLDGIPIRGDSYVFARYDSTGFLSYMDVRWETFDKIYAKSSVDKQKRNELHKQNFNELIEKVNQDFKEKNLRGTLYNSVNTLLRLENENGEVMLVPNVTFIGQYTDENGADSVPMVFDIPIDASLVPPRAIVSR